MRKVYCYAEKEEKPEEIDHSGDIVQDLSSLDISDLKNRSFFFIGGEIIENPYYEPSEYMKRVYESIDAQYEKFYRSDNDKKDSEEKDDAKDAEEETNKQSSDDEMPDWIAEMPYGELIKRFPGGISEALEYAKKEQGLSVPEVHYDSPEPEKLGVKDFTKNAEVYLAPGEGEETLKHELGHVIQQKKEKIPATTKIGEQQVNLDPKLEQEADEFAEHIEDHIPEIISNESTNTETKDVIQCELPSDRELGETIRNVAQHNNIPAVIMDDEKVNDILKKIKLQYEDDMSLSLELFHRDVRDDPDFMLKMQVRKELEKDAECGIYLSLSEDRSKIGNRADDEEGESERITEIMDMLSTEKIFIGESGQKDATLHNVLSILTEDQQESVKNSILKLKVCCDAEGVKSVLEGASKNVNNNIIHLEDFKNLKITSPKSVDSFKESFVKRLKLMADYIEDVYENKEYNGEKIGKNYWIRSTGSDPHKNGEHALFLVGKQSKDIERVYKPHDLVPDAVVIGQNGIFAELNRIIATGPTILGGEPALATMEIGTDSHTEKLINPMRTMTPVQANRYFFRAGILDFITRAMAVIDLHCENIMPTEEGPIIIDAEVNFLDKKNTLFATGSEGECALKTYEIVNNPSDLPKIANSAFTITGGGKNGEDIKSNQAFGDQTYYTCYTDGFDFMMERMNEETIRNRFVEFYLSKIKSVNQIRIIPVPTNQLAGNLQSAIQGRYIEDSSAQLSITVDSIKRGLKNKTLIFNNQDNNLKINIYDEPLRQAVEKTFINGTIIALYFDMKGEIYLDDTKIAQITTNEGADIA